MDMSHYEISVYNTEGEQLSLNADRNGFDEIRARTVWEAVGALSVIPSHAWTHWEGGESERVPVAQIKLKHFEMRKNSRGHLSPTMNTLEVIDRNP